MWKTTNKKNLQRTPSKSLVKKVCWQQLQTGTVAGWKALLLNAALMGPVVQTLCRNSGFCVEHWTFDRLSKHGNDKEGVFPKMSSCSFNVHDVSSIKPDFVTFGVSWFWCGTGVFKLIAPFSCYYSHNASWLHLSLDPPPPGLDFQTPQLQFVTQVFCFTITVFKVLCPVGVFYNYCWKTKLRLFMWLPRKKDGESLFIAQPIPSTCYAK